MMYCFQAQGKTAVCGSACECDYSSRPRRISLLQFCCPIHHSSHSSQNEPFEGDQTVPLHRLKPWAAFPFSVDPGGACGLGTGRIWLLAAPPPFPPAASPCFHLWLPFSSCTKQAHCALQLLRELLDLPRGVLPCHFPWLILFRRVAAPSFHGTSASITFFMALDYLLTCLLQIFTMRTEAPCLSCWSDPL